MNQNKANNSFQVFAFLLLGLMMLFIFASPAMAREDKCDTEYQECVAEVSGDDWRDDMLWLSGPDDPYNCQTMCTRLHPTSEKCKRSCRAKCQNELKKCRDQRKECKEAN